MDSDSFSSSIFNFSFAWFARYIVHRDVFHNL